MEARSFGGNDQHVKVGELFSSTPASVDWDRVSRESMPLFLLATDIRKNGLKEPILLDEDGKIVDGIHRMFVLWLLGYDEDVPVKEVINETA